MAKLFGYAKTTPTPAPVLAGLVTKAVEAAKAEQKSEEGTKTVTVNPPTQARVKPMAAVRKDSKFDEESHARPTRKDSLIQSEVDAVHSKPIAAVNSQQPVAKPQQAKKVVKVTKPSISSLDDIMNLLEDEVFTTSPASSSIVTKKDLGGKAKSVKSSLSSLDEMMSSLENEMTTPNSPRKSPPVTEKEAVRGSVRRTATAGKRSLSSLDEMMNSLEQDWDMSALDPKAPVLSTSFARATQKLALYTKGTGETMVGAKPPSYGQDFVASPASYTSQRRQASIDISGIEPHPDENDESTEKPLLEYMKEAEEMRLERERMEMERQRILQEEVAFQREAEKFAEEEEQMRKFVENLKIEEERDLENQERRRKIAEEKRRAEEAEAKRIQDLEDERVALESAERLNKENERIEKERRERESRMYQERVEMERLRYVEQEARLREQRMVDDRIAREAEEREERLRYEREQIKIENDRIAREQEEEEELRYEQEQARFKAQRLKAEENAKLRRQAEAERVERERYENRRLEEQQAEAANRNYWRSVKENEESSRQEKEDAQLDSRGRGNERIVEQRERVESARGRRLDYSREQNAPQVQQQDDKRYEEDSEPEVLTKEQEMQKAEEKIRAAFAGLAQEKAQISSGVKPAGGLIKAGIEVGVQERGVSRYNTVGAGPRPRQEPPMGVSRGNTVGVRANKSVGGGLPNGPKGGFGLPGRPNVGLPTGPRPRGRA